MKKSEQAAPEIAQSSIDRYSDDVGTSAVAIRSLEDIKRISTIFIGSGMFKGSSGMSEEQRLYQAGVKIIAGIEFGIQPFAAMRGINIIQGNAEMSANLMAAKVKKHPKYDYRVKQWDNDGCVIEFYELPTPGAPRTKWDLLGKSSFDIEDAKTAGLANGDNWRKFARNMFFARAMSNGVRIYTPDVFYGAPVYVEGEISGEVVDVEEAEPDPPTIQVLDPAGSGQLRTVIPADDVATVDQLDHLEELMQKDGIGQKAIDTRLKTVTTEVEAAEAIKKMEDKLAEKEAA